MQLIKCYDADMANIIAGLILLSIGGFMVLCTHSMIRFQIWSQRVIVGAQYIPSKRTYAVMRIVGSFLAILGIFVGMGVIK